MKLAAGLELQFFQSGIWPVHSYPALIREGTTQGRAGPAKKPFQSQAGAGQVLLSDPYKDFQVQTSLIGLISLGFDSCF